MSMFLGIDASASGLTAERLRMDVISNNIANANTTRTREGGAYHRRYVVFKPRDRKTSSVNFENFLQEFRPKAGRTESMPMPFGAFMQKASRDLEPGEGVRAVSIETDETQGPLTYDPGHPDANADGYVERPNVNIVAEMVDMITASRAYEANATAINAAKSMATKALDIAGN